MRSAGSVVAMFTLLGAVLGGVEVLAAALTVGRFDVRVSVAVVLAWLPVFFAAGLLAAGLRALAPRPLRETPAPLWASALGLGLLVWLHALALVVLPRVNPRRLGNPLLLVRETLETTALAGLAGLVLAALLWALAPRARRGRAGVQALAFATGALALLGAGVALRRSVGVAGREGTAWLAAGTAAAALVGAGAVLRLGLRRGALLLAVAVAVAGAVRVALPPSALSAVRRDAFPPAPAAKTPNVVVIVLDTVRADHLELHGYERATMPRLARFARGARVHTDAVADSSWTLPSHASLFTGLTPREHGAHGGPAGSDQPGGRGARPLEDDATTLAEVLRDHGYATVGVGANWSFLRPRYGLDQGFAAWDARAAYRGAVLEGHVPMLVRAMPALDASPLRALAEPLFRHDVAQVMYRRADEITDEAIGWLQRPRLREGPFLLFVNYFDAHEPYRPPGGFEDRFPGRVKGAPRGRLGFPDALGDEALRDHLVAQYDGELAFLDVHLGRLLDALETEGRLEDTLVVITSDHGEAFGERGRYGHGTSLYQTELFVPLVIHDPARAAAPRRPDAPTQLRAVAPWLLGRLGLDAPAGMPAPIARPEDLGPVEAELLGRKADGEGYDDLRALRDGPLKLVLEAEGPELYDLARDPHERHDLAPARPDDVARLAGALATLGSAAARAGGVAPISEDELERLRALGYAE